ncbi:MAG: cytochrome c biogenesis protein ResB [Geobacter sp.]|nr:MAG: cytochrome c biogenesis protein ResB [Geobacter sp.]
MGRLRTANINQPTYLLISEQVLPGRLPLKNQPSDFGTSLWRFFSSLKLTIFLLIGLAVVSVIGTIIPQGNPPPVEYLQTISQAKFDLYSKLGFFNMYHSWWFVLLLYLLTLNLVACSLRRFPHDWKLINGQVPVLDEQQEKSLANVQSWKVSQSAADLKKSAAEILGRGLTTPVVTKVNDEYHLFAEKGRFSRLGVYILHFSIIIVFIGAMVGSFFGFKGFAQIPEGDSITTASTTTGKVIDLGFAVRCDSFSLTLYDTGAPKEYRSVLSVIENGKTVIDKQPIIVNSPLTYRGITFYQSSYSQDGNPSFHFTVRNRTNGTETQMTATGDQPLALPGGETLTILGFAPDVGSIYPGFSGPAVQVQVQGKGPTAEPFALLQKYPAFNADKGGDYVISFAGADQKWRTGLQVTKDPGVWVVWLGCFLLVSGIFVSFFLSHRRIWIRIGAGRIVVAGSSNKNQAAFRITLDEIVDKLKKI